MGKLSYSVCHSVSFSFARLRLICHQNKDYNYYDRKDWTNTRLIRIVDKTITDKWVSMASGRVYSVSIASVYLLGKYNIVYMPYSTSYSFITNYILCFSKRVIFARFLYDVPFITRNIFRRIIGEAIKVRSIVLFHSVSRQNWITLGSRNEWVLSKKQSLASSTLLWNIIRIKRMPSSDFLATGCGFRLSTRLASHFRKIKYIGSFEYISTISSTFVSRLFFFQHLPTVNVNIATIRYISIFRKLIIFLLNCKKQKTGDKRLFALTLKHFLPSTGRTKALNRN